jgi:hypothetical protein
MLGRDNADPLFLQAKEAQPSVLEPFAGRSRLRQHGERVVVGQRLMQAASDIFLGWIRVTDLDGQPRDYCIRQFHDWKGSAEVETMRVPGATLYARMCGATLARAHARWGDRIAVGAYLGSGEVFDRAIARLCGGLRRPERAGLRGAGSGGQVGPHPGGNGCVSRTSGGRAGGACGLCHGPRGRIAGYATARPRATACGLRRRTR